MQRERGIASLLSSSPCHSITVLLTWSATCRNTYGVNVGMHFNKRLHLTLKYPKALFSVTLWGSPSPYSQGNVSAIAEVMDMLQQNRNTHPIRTLSNRRTLCIPEKKSLCPQENKRSQWCVLSNFSNFSQIISRLRNNHKQKAKSSNFFLINKAPVTEALNTFYTILISCFSAADVSKQQKWQSCCCCGSMLLNYRWPC